MRASAVHTERMHRRTSTRAAAVCGLGAPSSHPPIACKRRPIRVTTRVVHFEGGSATGGMGCEGNSVCSWENGEVMNLMSEWGAEGSGGILGMACQGISKC
eukprot:1178818-Prorocentrum_minimum.AAC.2